MAGEPPYGGEPRVESRRRSDMPLLAATLALVGLGITMVYSASSIMAQERFGDGYFFLKRQAIYAAAGISLMAVAIRFNYQWIRKLAVPGLVLSLLLLVAVLFPKLGISAGGTRRWLRLGGFSFQPAEVAKLALVAYLARFLDRKGKQVSDFFNGFLPPMLVAALAAGLVILQPDFGSAALILCLAAIMVFLGGARLSHLGLAAVLSLPVAYFLVLGAAYRKERILAFLNPWKDPQSSGFQIIQSYLAFGSGGISGLGLGNGRQKLFYLPEAHTDFIMSVIGEELGFIGVGLVVLAFLVLVVRGVVIAIHSPDLFGYYLGLGITFMITFQAAVNMAVVTGLLPTKGLTLPLLSYGGTSLILNLVAVGLLLSISSRRRLGYSP